MVLKLAAAADFAEVVDLANAAYRGSGKAAGWATEEGLIEGLRLTEERLHDDVATKPEASLLLYRDETSRELSGTVWLEPKADQVWYPGLLTVRPELQDRRLGRALLSAAEDFARERGGRRMRMTVVNAREALIQWYERRGYRMTGEKEPFPYGDERFGRPLRDDLAFVVLEKQL